jgi:elongation factor G
MSISYPIKQLRNIGIIAHIDAGKTTLTERILFYSGRTHRVGQVDEGTTVTDWMAQERERGITITAATITTTWQDTVTGEEAQINIIDTPGHIDFTAEVQRSLRVLDGGVVIFDAVSGVEPQSETVWHQADRYSVPRICFVNKMDRVGADFHRTVQMISDRLTAHPLAVQLPYFREEVFAGVIDLIQMKTLLFPDEPGAEVRVEEVQTNADVAYDARERLVERIAGTDEGLTLKFLRGEEIPNRDLYGALRRAVIANKLFPVLVGSAQYNKGIQPLLDGVVRYLPSPLDIVPTVGSDPSSGERAVCRVDPDEPFCSLAFKVVSDPFVGRLTYMRVYSGTLTPGSTVYNARRQCAERISRLFQMYANKRQETKGCRAGDIVAVVGLKQSFTGDTLCDPNRQVLLEPIEFPAPVIKVAVEPQSQADQHKLMRALRRLADEDPTFRVAYDEQTSQTIISGMGELHLEIIVDRLRREFQVGCGVSRPEAAYKETITTKARAEGRYIHQTGGRGQYAVVWLEIAPNEPGKGFCFENLTTNALIPQGFIPAIERGVMEASEQGVLAGYPLTDIKVTVVDGRYHEVDSSKRDFEIAGSIAFKDACQKASPILLEPIMQVATRVSSDHVGGIVNDFSGRRGRIEGIELESGEIYLVKASVPLSEMFGYVTDLRSLTSGRGTFTMQFERYLPVHSTAAKEIIRARDASRQLKWRTVQS